MAICRGDNTDLPGVRSIPTPLVILPVSDLSIKHLAGHQFDIGRVVTGIRSTFP